MTRTIAQRLDGECEVRPGVLETATWRVRWDADCLVVGRVDSLEEPVRTEGHGLIVQVSRARVAVRPSTVSRLFGGAAEPEIVHQLHVELRGRDLEHRVRLCTAVEVPDVLDGLDELELTDADAVASSALVIDLIEAAVALGAGVARSGGAEVSAESMSALRQERDGQIVKAGRLQRERDALQARITELDDALTRAQARIAKLEAKASENARLRRQVDYLEGQASEATRLREELKRLVTESGRLRRDNQQLRDARLNTARAHNLAQPSACAAAADADVGLLCGACLSERGESHVLVYSAMTVAVASGSARLRLCGCPRCGAASFVRDPGDPAV